MTYNDIQLTFFCYMHAAYNLCEHKNKSLDIKIEFTNSDNQQNPNNSNFNNSILSS